METHDNERLIGDFYTAFQEGDADTMARAYTANANFRDPVFELHGPAIGDMWRMFCRSGGVDIEFSEVTADGETGSAHWEARYVFPSTGRQVHNVIEASFRFEDGAIAEHVDEFDLGAWARQALGITGALFGKTRFLQTRVREQAAGQLERFRRARD